jgi:hypothetical protein
MTPQRSSIPHGASYSTVLVPRQPSFFTINDNLHGLSTRTTTSINHAIQNSWAKSTLKGYSSASTFVSAMQNISHNTFVSQQTNSSYVRSQLPAPADTLGTPLVAVYPLSKPGTSHTTWNGKAARDCVLSSTVFAIWHQGALNGLRDPRLTPQCSYSSSTA